VGDDEPGQRLAQRLVAAVAKDSLRGRVELHHPPRWPMAIQQYSADSKIAGSRRQGDSSCLPNTSWWPWVNTALLLPVLVGGEGAVKLPVGRSVWHNREDADA
jgi:hypothetical protein